MQFIAIEQRTVRRKLKAVFFVRTSRAGTCRRKDAGRCRLACRLLLDRFARGGGRMKRSESRNPAGHKI